MCSSSHTETENDPVIQILCDFFKSFEKKQMGYNNPFEIFSLSAKKIVPLPRLKRRKIQLFKSLFSFFISDYDITPIAKIDLSSVPSIFTMA